MYRHPRVAEHAQIAALRIDVARLREALHASERRREALEQMLVRARDGVAPELHEHQRTVRSTLVTLGTLSAFFVVGTFILAIALSGPSAHEPMLSVQGVRNLVWIVGHRELGAILPALGGALLAALPWLVTPWIGLAGMQRGRRWGWSIAMIALALYLPTPLCFVALPGIAALRAPALREVAVAHR